MEDLYHKQLLLDNAIYAEKTFNPKIVIDTERSAIEVIGEKEFVVLRNSHSIVAVYLVQGNGIRRLSYSGGSWPIQLSEEKYREPVMPGFVKVTY